jgi:hypothetical protein
VMPADDPCPGGSRPLVGGKHVWPQPNAAGTGVCSCQGERSQDGAIPLGDIVRMDALDTRSMFLEWADQAFRPHGDAIAIPVPSRTTIGCGAPSRSVTRSCRHAIRHTPVP